MLRMTAGGGRTRQHGRTAAAPGPLCPPELDTAENGVLTRYYIPFGITNRQKSICLILRKGL